MVGIAATPALTCDTAPIANRIELVDQVVVELNGICKTATFDFAMKVGRLIVHSFYAGDLARWRHRGVKNVSFRKLAKHPNLPMSASALYRSVAIYEVCARLGIDSWKHVSTSHIRLVLALPKEEQARLLQVSEEESWPARRLRDEVCVLRVPRSTSKHDDASASRAFRLRQMVESLGRFVDVADGFVGDSDADVDIEISSERAQSFVSVLRRARRACVSLEGRLTKCLEGAQVKSRSRQGNHLSDPRPGVARVPPSADG